MSRENVELERKGLEGHVFDLRDGKVVRWRIFAGHRQARGAAGLPE